MITHLPRRTRSVVGVSLLLVLGAACSSDSDSNTDTTAATTEAPASTDDDRLDGVPLPTATDDREAIVEYVGNVAEARGIEFDEQCVTDLIAQMSDADVALVADSARRGLEGSDPELSAEGEAIGNQVEDCETSRTTTTS